MADFPYSPNFGARCKPRYNTETTKYENEEEDSRLLTSKKLRTWENLTFSARTPTEMTAVNIFYDTYKEDLTAFSMVIDGETVTGKMDKGSFWFVHTAPYVYEYGFTFREVP
jgi:hypothetical protein